jgi:lipopolysaccharide/colanic/teichoic acid biosynthesis glycosyltransferase
MMCLNDYPFIVPHSRSAARRGSELMSWSEHIHRTCDFAAAATGVILLAPIFLMTSIAIKLDSDGPVFVREPMFGHGDRRIQLFKFRFVSTRGGANAPARPTRIGQALSETGIHELPQLFNVLRGELSIMGPPPSPCPNALLNKVKPGMIQWAQMFASRRQRPNPPRF